MRSLSLKHQRAVEKFLESSQLQTAGVPPFVGKIDSEMQPVDYGILSGSKSFARPVSSARVAASPAQWAFMRTIVLAAAALTPHDKQLGKSVPVRDHRRSRLGMIVQKEESHEWEDHAWFGLGDASRR